MLTRDDLLDRSRNPVASFVNYRLAQGDVWPGDFNQESIEASLNHATVPCGLLLSRRNEKLSIYTMRITNFKIGES